MAQKLTMPKALLRDSKGAVRDFEYFGALPLKRIEGLDACT